MSLRPLSQPFSCRCVGTITRSDPHLGLQSRLSGQSDRPSEPCNRFMGLSADSALIVGFIWPGVVGRFAWGG